MANGTLYIIAAPSGAGKTSLVNALIDSTCDLTVSISHTTRAPRPGEKHGVDYFFVDQAKFDSMVANELFLEHAIVFGNLYGTSSAWVQEQLEAGIDVILEIDWQGAQQVRMQFTDYISIFILPPSLDVLRLRLQQRAQDNNEVIEQRMTQASAEISHYAEYDYLVVNDDFAIASMELQALIKARRLRQQVQAARYDELLKDLLV